MTNGRFHTTLSKIFWQLVPVISQSSSHRLYNTFLNNKLIVFSLAEGILEIQFRLNSSEKQVLLCSFVTALNWNTFSLIFYSFQKFKPLYVSSLQHSSKSRFDDSSDNKLKGRLFEMKDQAYFHMIDDVVSKNDFYMQKKK